MAAKTLRVRNADSLKKLKRLPNNCMDSMVTDPPSGTLAIGSKTKWDHNHGGRDNWIKWLQQILSEAHRVLKPGSYSLVWTLPRTQHWTAMAIENAGFEIVDVVMNLFSRSMIKGQDASVAIDNKLGLKRKVTGKNPNHRKRNTDGAGFVYNAKTHDTESTDPRSKRWEGWRTNLKPGQECWILCRKAHKGTIADNILTYGVGAVRVGKKGKERIQSNVVVQHAADCTVSSCEPTCPVHQLGEQSPKAPSYFRSVFYSDKIGRRERQEEGITHPTPKTQELMQFLVRTVTPRNGVVLDPFMGSGSTGAAALRLGCRFYGIELDPVQFKQARKRLRGIAKARRQSRAQAKTAKTQAKKRPTKKRK